MKTDGRPAKKSGAKKRPGLWFGLAFALTVGLGLMGLRGCRGYPEVNSREAMETIKLLYNACSSRDPVRLEAAALRLGDLEKNGDLTHRESAAFRQILDDAQSGQWDRARDSCLQFAEDQVR